MMIRRLRHAVAVAALGGGAMIPSAAMAASDAELAEIRSQIEAMKSQYENRIGALEAQLRKAEQAAEVRTQAPAAPVPAQPGPRPASAPATTPASAAAFNPAISAVLNGTFGKFSRDPDNAAVPGFFLGPETDIGTRGFSLGESEINLSANVDQVLLASLTVALSPEDEVEVEEGYIQSTSLPYGFTLRAGRFFSGIGYINEKHAHDWDFVDAALPYRAFLATQYRDDGVQARWLAPTDFFLEFGGEAFRGDQFPAAGARHDGKGSHSLFARAGDDINASSSWLAGLSYLRTKSSDRGNDAGDLFGGIDDTYIASLVYKWAPGGNAQRRNLTLAGEYFRRRERGTFNSIDIDGWQSGFYVQAVYQLMPRWKIGLRHDHLFADTVDPALAGSTLDDQGRNPRRNTVMVEYDTSEFGRFRLQYNRDQADVAVNNEFLLQYTVVLGPHGAHRY